MGVMKRFEQRLEGLVNGTFAKVFKSEVQPVEIAGALQRECDNNAQIWNRERTVVPNDFIVELSTPDYERLSPYSGQLGDELAGPGQGLREAAAVHLHGPDQGPPGEGRGSRHRSVPRPQPHSGVEYVTAAAARGRTAAAPAAGPGTGSRRLRVPPAGAPPMPASPPPGASGHRPAAAARPTAPGPGTHGGAGTTVRHWIEINGTRHQISRPTLVLGRSTDADVRIDDPGVSRRHCEIRTGTPSTIQDLGSTNGIVVDGQHTTRATLRDGSRIVVGSTTIVYRQAEG